jgi:rare lipoprotein A
MQKTVAIIFILTIFIIRINAQEIGTASYYSNRFQGARTMSGERLDNELFTAAHKTLPFGTLLKVTNLTNGKWVVVKINDRGKLKRGRIVDVSLVAAKELDMVKLGIAKVKAEIVQPAEGITIFNSLPIIPPQKIDQLPIKDIALPDKLAKKDGINENGNLLTSE